MFCLTRGHVRSLGRSYNTQVPARSSQEQVLLRVRAHRRHPCACAHQHDHDLRGKSMWASARAYRQTARHLGRGGNGCLRELAALNRGHVLLPFAELHALPHLGDKCLTGGLSLSLSLSFSFLLSRWCRSGVRQTCALASARTRSLRSRPASSPPGCSVCTAVSVRCEVCNLSLIHI